MSNSKQTTDRRQRRHRRVRSQVSGTPERPRLSVYRSNKHMYAQLIDDEAEETLVSASSLEMDIEGSLKDMAEQVGAEIADKAQDAGIETVVFDRGGYDYGGRVEALAEAARSGGLEF